nr:tubulin-specific chaperone D [Parasteatoda tepidariorum]
MVEKTVSDVEPVLSLLNAQDPHDASTWETRYMLLLWMSIIVMIPFHMHRLDDTTDEKCEKKPVMQRIIDVIKLYLSVSDKARDSAAFLAAQFITRPDVKDAYLGEYLDWCLKVSDVEPVLSLLNAQDPHDASTWETRYMLLLWMSIIVMIPFHMHRLDDTTDEKCEKKPVMQRIIDVIKLYLSVSDKARDSAAFLAAQFITRPDVKDAYLGEYLDWCLKMLISSDNQISLQAGILSSLALIFKHGKRDDVKMYGAPVLQKILDCGFKDSGSSVVRKMALKVIQRIGLSFLRIKIASWRYCRGKRSLTDNLACGDVAQNNPSVDESMEDENYDIPDETEDIIEQLLVGLRDKDTIIRWSAAKGIGRITSRLPKELADDVVTSVLELFSLRESDSAWHGGCLALAELGRRGLILPQHLDRVVSVVLKALIYDEQRGNFSVGAHIRDAACYVCWSFARAYDPAVLQPYVNSIAGALLITTIFDREITCRRAASAAFQENVGRQGTFPHGIEILTETDYYAVGSRQNSFLNLSVHIAQFLEYTLPLVNHLLDHKVNHWDPAVRELASKALHNLTNRAVSYMAKTAVPRLLELAVGINLNARHGSILSLAEIIHAISQEKDQNETMTDILGADVIEKLRALVFILDERGLFKGLGGILMRNAICLLFEKSSISALPFHEDKDLISKWREMLDSCLKHADVSVRSSAISALPHFIRHFFSNDKSYCSQLLKNYLDQLDSTHMETRCGFALAIGALPSFVLGDHVSDTIVKLSKCAEITEEHFSWAEVRRDAIKALSQIVTTVGFGAEKSENDYMNVNYLNVVFKTYLSGTQDYTLDSRGEIGAIVREAAMTAIQKRPNYATSKSALPSFVLRDHVSDTIVKLSKCAEITEEHSSWAEVRRDAIKALSQIVTTVGFGAEKSENDYMNVNYLNVVFKTYLSGTQDYTLDSRGEIGAIVREAAMTAIQDTLCLVIKEDKELVSADLIKEIFSTILQQCTEKIDRTRAVAGGVFETLLYCSPKIPHIPFHEELLDIFNQDVCSEINWASPGDTFQHFVKVLNFPCYRRNLLLGFVVSVGGLTESLVKFSSSALVSYLFSKQSDCDHLLKYIADELISILKENTQNDRIIVPFFKMANHLLLSGIEFSSEEKPSFHMQLMDLVWECSYKSRDPQKIIAAVDLFCNLLQFDEYIQKRILNKLMIFLCHRFPRVRKVTASQMYEAFLTYDVVQDEDVAGQVSSILCDTDWNKPIDELRPVRNSLCEKLGLEPPRTKAK